MLRIKEFSGMNREEKVLKEIGARLKKLREDAGYSSYENFAIQHELSRMQYWRMENGKVNLTIKSLLTVLNIHRISIEDFFLTPKDSVYVSKKSSLLIAAEKKATYKARRK
jgi:transcriptional regulator with XRE-family HTH domain